MNKKNNKTKSDHEQSDDESTTGKECALCHYVPERIIYLSCDHIICLVCATKLIISESDEKDIDFSEVQCGVCGESTVLSKEVQETLLEFLNSGDFHLDSEDEEDEDKEDEENEVEDSPETKKAGSKKKRKESADDLDNNDKEEEEEDEDGEQEEQEEDDGEEQNDQNESREEFTANFGCQLHDGEEYAYYNPNTRVLFCTQCLLSSKLQQKDLNGFKPLKKCFPEILQGFQDMINEVEVCRNLLDNKRKDFDIRRDNAKAQSQSYIRKFELAVEEMIDYLQEQKSRISQELENKLEERLASEENQESPIEARVDYFNAIVDQIGGFKQGDNPEEEIFGFFFANQEKIYTSLQDEKAQKNEEKQPFRNFESNLKLDHDKALNEFYRQAMERIQKIDNQFRPAREVQVPVVHTEETKRNPEANFSHFLQKIRQQSASYKERQSSIDNEKPMSRSKFNWNERQSRDRNTNVFNKTMERGTVQKMDIEKKLKLLDFRSRRDDYIQSVNTVNNFRKQKDSISTKLEALKQQLRSRPAQPQLNLSYKLK